MFVRKYRRLPVGFRSVVNMVADFPKAAAPGRMLAWRLHGYGQLEELKLEEARVPPLRSPEEVLVRVQAASINPIDVAMIGGYGSTMLNILRSFEGVEGVEFPLVPGRDFVGVVEYAGVESKLKQGLRVWGVVPPHRPGSFAEYVVVKNKWVGPAPEAMDDAAAGGTLYAALTACSALRVAGLTNRSQGNSRVLLLGLGGVGQAALQLLVFRGYQVIVGCSSDLHPMAQRYGAVAAFDRNGPDYYQKLIDSGPYEVILDCAGLGGNEATAHNWQFSRYVTLTTPLLKDADSMGVAFGVASAAAKFVKQFASAASRQMKSCPPPHVRWAYFLPMPSDIEMLRKLAERDLFKTEVEAVFPWWKAVEGFKRAAQGHARGKLIIDFTAKN